MSKAYDCIVIGAGAAGLFCALTAGQRGRRVLLLEHNREVGAKILISGGGRCNFTNLEAGKAERYLSANPHFARSALARYGPNDFIGLVQKHRIAFYEKTLGQLFCEGTGAARAIVRLLVDECAIGGVEIRTNCAVRGVSRGGRFMVETGEGDFESETLVVASGGLSIPKLGAGDLAFRLARQFGVKLIAPRPGLVPLTFAADDLAWMQALSGVSAPAIARAGKAAFAEGALFTHRGLSGPAILQISSYWREGEAIELDWAPAQTGDHLIQRKRERPKAQLKTVLSEILPARLAEHVAGERGAVALADMKDAALTEVMRGVKAQRVAPSGTEGYAKSEVTVGGVDTDALVQQSMMVKAIPGLFFIGEAVDVTGWLGGYNFQWAWSSAAAAGRAV